MADESIGVFTESAAKRVWAATKRVEGNRVDLRPAQRRRPPEASSGASILHGIIVCESAPGAADNFTDNRYLVEIGTYSDEGAGPLAFVVSGKVVEATNAHENTTGWHGLRAGTEVTLVAVAGGYKII